MQDLAYNIDDNPSLRQLRRLTVLLAVLSVILSVCCTALTIALMQDNAKIEDDKTALTAAGLAEEINGLIPSCKLQNFADVAKAMS